jgi:hypothetical protein
MEVRQVREGIWCAGAAQAVVELVEENVPPRSLKCSADVEHFAAQKRGKRRQLLGRYQGTFSSRIVGLHGGHHAVAPHGMHVKVTLDLWDPGTSSV